MIESIELKDFGDRESVKNSMEVKYTILKKAVDMFAMSYAVKLNLPYGERLSQNPTGKHNFFKNIHVYPPACSRQVSIVVSFIGLRL